MTHWAFFLTEKWKAGLVAIEACRVRHGGNITLYRRRSRATKEKIAKENNDDEKRITFISLVKDNGPRWWAWRETDTENESRENAEKRNYKQFTLKCVCFFSSPIFGGLIQISSRRTFSSLFVHEQFRFFCLLRSVSFRRRNEWMDGRSGSEVRGRR